MQSELVSSRWSDFIVFYSYTARIEYVGIAASERLGFLKNLSNGFSDS